MYTYQSASRVKQNRAKKLRSSVKEKREEGEQNLEIEQKQKRKERNLFLFQIEPGAFSSTKSQRIVSLEEQRTKSS